jgi:hypothetical protein
MKNLILIIVLILKPFICFSQNLLPNPSFELYNSCPSNLSQINYCVGWTGVGKSPDYFNSCATTSNVINVPINNFGYQPAHSGCGYAGIFTFSDVPFTPAWREFIQAPLSSTLIAGDKYYFSFNVSLCSAWTGTNKIGFRLSTMPYTPLQNDSSPAIDNFATFYTDSIITDTLNWTTISGSIIADSAYSYITFGNFFDAAHVQHIFLLGPDTNSYYFIDDVCFSPDSMTCVSVIDSCRASAVNAVSEYDRKINQPVFPNPFKESFNVNLNENEEYEFCMYQINSKLFLRKRFKGTLSLRTAVYPTGVYFYEIKNSKGLLLKTGKIIRD